MSISTERAPAHRARPPLPRTARAVTAAALAALVWMSPGIHAQDATRRDGQAWVRAVEAHEPGRRDDAVISIARWQRDELRDALSETARAKPPVAASTLRRALLLHTDIALLHRGPSGYSLPGTSSFDVVFADGQAVGQMTRIFHWEIGRQIVAMIPDAAERVRAGRFFYRATAAVLQLHAEHPELTVHLREGLGQIDDDPVLLMYEGTLQQTYASPRVQRFFDAQRSQGLARRPILPNAIATALAPTEALSRVQAVRLFRRALSVDPNLQEARIRLAHVLGDRGQHDDAVEELRRAMAAPLPAFLDYYASLLLGREEAARARYDEAQVAFERAASLHPQAQAPQLGLSHVAIARGSHAQALAYLRREDPAVANAAEPWWLVGRVHEPGAEALLSAMYEARLE